MLHWFSKFNWSQFYGRIILGISISITSNKFDGAHKNLDDILAL